MRWDGRRQVRLQACRPSLSVASGTEAGSRPLVCNSAKVPVRTPNRQLALPGLPVGRVYAVNGVVQLTVKTPRLDQGYELIRRDAISWTINSQQVRILGHTQDDVVAPRLDAYVDLWEEEPALTAAHKLIGEQLERFCNTLVADFIWHSFKPYLRAAWTDAHGLIPRDRWDGPRPEDALPLSEEWSWPELTALPEAGHFGLELLP